MKLQEVVGLNVQRFRREKGWSQEQLAFECSLDRTYISGIERGIRNPSIANIEKIAKALSIESHLLLIRLS